MANNIVSNISPELMAEIEAALLQLDKDGYTVRAIEEADGKLGLHFKFGESEQTLRAGGKWRESGVVSKLIVDHLNI